MQIQSEMALFVSLNRKHELHIVKPTLDLLAEVRPAFRANSELISLIFLIQIGAPTSIRSAGILCSSLFEIGTVFTC